MKFYVKDLFSKCDQTDRKLRILSHLLKKSLAENFIFGAVSLEMSLINCKIELKFKWSKRLVTAGNDNTDASPANIIFTVKDTKLYVPAATLSRKENEKLSKLLIQ